MGFLARLLSAVGKVSESRLVSDCNPGVASLILAQSHTLVENDHEMISTANFLPSADLKRVVVNYKRKYVHEVLVNAWSSLPRKKCG